MGYAVQYQMKTQKSLLNTNDFYYGSEFSPRGYAWNFPRNHESVVGTGGLVNKVHESSRRAFDYLDYLIQDVEPASTELKDVGATVVKIEAALIPFAGIIRPSFGKRLLLAGDAACYCSPISGDGIHYSMIGGPKAAETAAAYLQKNNYSKKALSRYERDWIKALG